MSNYFYVTFLFVACIYAIIKSIYSFNKGKYNPYIFFGKETNKQRIFNFGLSVTISLSLYNLMLNTKPPLFIFQLSFIVFSLCFTLGINVLNYLSYVKIKDHKIIHQTIIFDICVIAFCLWTLYLH